MSGNHGLTSQCRAIRPRGANEDSLRSSAHWLHHSPLMSKTERRDKCTLNRFVFLQPKWRTYLQPALYLSLDTGYNQI